ncbi:MAG: N-acyl amino acid synthase, PEP-CTERM/exosortase system-associated [Candidatus Nitrotoga sp. SPKER]|nr:MAG: N-acyl amino acid synthase, PEP-CTERM/exosortase system-associated [Candidatus Nitrotoga sp. SPKER]
MVEKKFVYSIVTPGTRAYSDYLSLRHTVFCEELKRIPSINRFFSDVPLECDAYDAHSVHVLCRSLETGAAVGCSRLILPNNKGLSITSRYPMSHQITVSSSQIGEIGRLAISKELRRNRGELSSAGLHQRPSQRPHPASATEKQDGPYVAMGLYNEIFKLANKHGITHCYAAMEPSLARLLTRIGFPFQIAGPLNHAVQPPRQPYFLEAHVVKSVLANRDTYPSHFRPRVSRNESVLACQ